LKFALAFVLLASLIFAQGSNLTCQYRENVTNEVEKLNVYALSTNQFITNEIKPSNIEDGSPICRFELHNNYDVPISMRVMFRYVIDTGSSPGRYIERFYDNLVDVLPRDFQKISINTEVSSHMCNFDKATIKVILKENNDTYVRYEKENIVTEHCQECPPHSGNVCLNDGVSCNSNTDCGSGFCIMGRCSTDKNCCYLNDCQCGANEIQCECHSCVKRRALPPGTKTLCNLSEECANGLMDEVGVCKKLNNGEVCASANLCEGGYCVRGKCTDRPDILGDVISIIWRVFNSILPIFAFLLIVGLIFLIIVIGFYLFNKKLENDRARTEIERIKLEAEQKIEKIQSLNEEIDELIRQQNLVKLRFKEASKNELLEREKRQKEIRELEATKKKTLEETATLDRRLKELNKQVASREFEVSVKKKCTLATKKGDTVQSKGEQLIADFLYANNIDYDYDKQITLRIGRFERWVRPDFYLTAFNVVIEYWGMRGDPEYDRKMDEKKRLYKETKTRFISVEPDELGQIDEILKTKLESVGCKL